MNTSHFYKFFHGSSMKKIISTNLKISFILLLFNWTLFAGDKSAEKVKEPTKIKNTKTICPEGMVHIPRGLVPFKEREDQKGTTLTFLEEFCIDQYEFPNKKGEMPSVNITWFEAEEYCKKERKRLCTGEEWEKACAGKEWLKYSYGNTFIPSNCRHGKTPRKDVDRSGSNPFCKNLYGVHDMIGGVWEWTSDPFYQTYVKRGGYINAGPDQANCFSRAQQQAKSGGIHDGFRCCKDIPPDESDK
ncbi:formylglycine-generating enzyme family protein [bacterium]|nr:formylglycine-generating enzyme family protein [bacterium]